MIFVLLTALVSGGILFFSIDRSSLEALRGADPAYLAAAALLVAAMWTFDALKLKSLTSAAGESMTFGLALKLTWINYFGAALTPMQSGGGPFQMYIMYKNGIAIGKTVAITLVRTFMSILILGMAVPFAFVMRDDMPKMGWQMRGFLFYVALAVCAVVVFFVASLAAPRVIKAVFRRIVGVLGCIGIIKKDKVERAASRVDREIDAYRENIWDFLTTGRSHFLIAFVYAALQFAAYLSVMPMLILSLGYDVRVLPCVIIQAIFIFSLFFMPTPGGSGAAEGGAVLVASLFAPTQTAGVIGIAWRLFTEYTGIALGIAVAVRVIGWSVANKIASRSGDEVANEAGER